VRISAARTDLQRRSRRDTIGADELFWRGVLDPRDRALDQGLVGSRD
jgi:hypothetical protein